MIICKDNEEPTCKQCLGQFGFEKKKEDKSIGSIRVALKKEGVVIPDGINVLLDLLENAESKENFNIDLKWITKGYKPDAKEYRYKDAKYLNKYNTPKKCVLEIILDCE